MMRTPEIFNYMKFRAEQEGVPFELNAMFFKHNLDRGVRLFFGVETDCEGGVLRDTRSPDTLVAFRSS